MKIYIKSSLKSFPNALADLLDDLESGLFEEFLDTDDSEFSFEINREHRCVDVFKNGSIYAQVYPQYQRHSKPYDSAKFVYVGPGKGDYRKATRKSATPLYDADDFYIKYVDFAARALRS